MASRKLLKVRLLYTQGTNGEPAFVKAIWMCAKFSPLPLMAKVLPAVGIKLVSTPSVAACKRCAVVPERPPSCWLWNPHILKQAVPSVLASGATI
ncbi:hypothetical protein D3C77_615840 [compost metagenome]